MPRVWLITRRRFSRPQAGFLSLEVMLAAVVFGFLSVAIAGAIIYGRQSTAASGDHSRAAFLADECVEAIRSMRDADFANLTNGTHGLSGSGSQWAFSGASDTSGIFTRQAVVSEADSTRKDIDCTVSWTTGSVSRQVTSASRLTNWQASITPPGPANGPIMMVYSQTTTTPFYRIWDGSAWSAESSAMNVGGNINYVVLKSSPTRNEAVLGTQDDAGGIWFQVWDGSAWGNRTQVGTGPATTRSFDIAYEKTSGRAVIAYSAGADFAYRTWDGSSLSSATTVTAPPTTGQINWMELRQNPLDASNEIAMIMLDANADVYGMLWNGSNWTTMFTAGVWDATASIATRKGIDVEYEQNSGHILFAWGDGTSPNNNYRTWNGSTLSGVTTLGIAAQGGASQWLQLAARPGADEIMLGVQDAGADINTRKWSGSGWDTATQHPEHEPSSENIDSRNFDIVWETHSSNPGKAWLVWGDGATRSERQWSPVTGWGSITVASGSDDTSFVRLRADSASGAVFSGIYQCSCSSGANRDINERHLTGGSSTWTASNQLWGGPTTANPAHFKIDIASP